MPRESLGDVEHLILVALLHLDHESYGVPIMKEIMKRTGRTIARPAVYIALKRLEAKGFVTSRVGDATPQRGGRSTRLFKLTKAGARQLRDARETFLRMWSDAEHLVHKAAR
ncbi:MAG TPA: helix-turn-helix transcriptional regulator [Vicinamibacterales bacterium]|nr:helix-turn-helix transcriptional regulator [Vicinamibacterales bacterium]